MTMIREPVWCTFCEDRPAVGRMVVMRDRSREQIDVIDIEEGAACDLHGRAWTGVPIMARDDTGAELVLQYVHPDFERVTETQIINFAGEKTCVRCGDPTEEMPLWIAERLIRAYPGLVVDSEYQWYGICRNCAKNDHADTCPHCGEPVDDDADDADDDEDDDGDRWRDQHTIFH